MPLVSVLNWYRMRACPAKPTPPPEPFSPSLQTLQQPHQPKPGSAAPPKRPRRSNATLLLQKPLRKRMPVGTGNSRASESSEWGAFPCFAAATKNVDAVNSKWLELGRISSKTRCGGSRARNSPGSQWVGEESRQFLPETSCPSRTRRAGVGKTGGGRRAR